MKKKVLAVAAVLMMSVGTGFASPINELDKGQTAVGVGTDSLYLEHKISNSFTLGFQTVDRDDYGHMNDIYGQFALSNHLRGILGSRDVNSDSKIYAGIAANGTIAPDWAGYASVVGNNQFTEVQVGTNYKLTNNTDLNLNYHSFMPDVGKDKNGVGVGLTLKF